ncbi:pyridoxal kinase [Tribolium castaneum]|uniref:Pyridoxal kinase n=1 Tax=Tribolium castaneum TaxID=7070 RepID=D6WEG5_TRICA|nr:PREDICTED: pyridoxal kinase [Tribolium castaneum]EFA00408.1 Pyridoxal kinase-like Protein [Tribolium castaneum]|eukprot:XP_972953.1 PREDICTED: pyridoxal kinase [Tribolium castaneum]
MSESPRVLSIQSHVVSGYVGNKSATFPLQLLGFEVDFINSVQFCNHTGYKKVAGQVLTEKDLDDLALGLEANNLDLYSHLLTGYIGAASFLTRICALVKHLKDVNPSLTYVCDPVMGDNGRMYVPADLLPIYKSSILPLADIITPNQYEVELLTDMKINNVEEAWKAVDFLHSKGPKIVVVSSTELGNNEHLLALASKRQGNSCEKVTIRVPKLSGSFTGTGDLFAALFLAWMHKTGNNLKESLEKTVSTLQAVLKRTIESARGEVTPRAKELKLIQSKKDIENPTIVASASVV